MGATVRPTHLLGCSTRPGPTWGLVQVLPLDPPVQVSSTRPGPTRAAASDQAGRTASPTLTTIFKLVKLVVVAQRFGCLLPFVLRQTKTPLGVVFVNDNPMQGTGRIWAGVPLVRVLENLEI